jgi:hypothetical protein
MSTGLDSWGFYGFSQVLFIIIIAFLMLWNAIIYAIPFIKYMKEMNENGMDYGIMIIIIMIIISIILVSIVLNQVLSIYKAYKVAENSQNLCGIEYIEFISGRYKLYEVFGKPDESIVNALVYLVFSSSLTLLVINAYPFIKAFLPDIWFYIKTKIPKPGRDYTKSTLITCAILYFTFQFCFTLASLSIGFFDMKYTALTDVNSTNRTNIGAFMIALMFEIAFLCITSYLVGGHPFSTTNVLFACISIIILGIYFVISDSFQTIKKSIDIYETMVNSLNSKVTTLLEKLASNASLLKDLKSMIVKNIRYYSAEPIPGSDEYVLSQYAGKYGLYILHQNWKELHEIYDKLASK